MRSAIQYIFLIITLITNNSCVGKKEPMGSFSVTISADQPNINVESGESVRLRVKNYSVDVTDQADIYYIEDGNEIYIEGSEFIAPQSGEYLIAARYDGVNSKDYGVVRAYTTDELTSEFYRRNIVMKFTGTWCANCPAMGEAIESVEYSSPNRIIEISMHCVDDLAVEESTQIAADYSFSTLPVALVDMGGSTNISSTSLIKGLIDSSIASNPTMAGVRINTSLDNMTLNVEVGVKSTLTMNCRVAVAVVTDNFNYPQTGSDDANYKQDNVLRFYLSDIYGDELDELQPNIELTQSYSATLTSESLASESRVIAYVLNEIDGKYVVNNTTECVIGCSIDYMYEINEL